MHAFLAYFSKTWGLTAFSPEYGPYPICGAKDQKNIAKRYDECTCVDCQVRVDFLMDQGYIGITQPRGNGKKIKGGRIKILKSGFLEALREAGF